MYNVLIVDDEVTLVNSLYEYITSKNAMEYECRKAYSSKQAMQVAEHFRIDIAILDIEMPGMNGLELREWLKCVYPHCRVIFLTAYDRFDYAYAAAQQYHTRFLLKTEGYTSVLNMLREESAAMDQELIYSYFPSEQEGLTLLGHGKNDFLRMVLSGEMDEEAIEEEAIEFANEMDLHEPIMPVLIRMVDGNGHYRKEKNELIQTVLFFKKWFEGKYSLQFLQLSRNYALFLMQPIKKDAIYTDLKQELELFVGKVGQVCSRNISLILADDWTKCGQLSSKLRLMMGKLENCSEFDREYVSQLDANNEDMTDMIRLSDALVDCLERNDEDGILKKLSEGWEIADKTGCSLPDFLFQQFERVQSKHVWDEWRFNFKQMAQFAYELEHAKTKDDLTIVAVKFARRIAHRKTEQTTEELKYVVRSANDFIEAHYAEDISLTDVAGHVGLSSSYFSRIYKKETGMSTVDKIKEVRIREAIRYLKTTNLKIQDIALAVGYNSSRYFLSVFRNVIGIGPSEYREKEGTQ